MNVGGVNDDTNYQKVREQMMAQGDVPLPDVTNTADPKTVAGANKDKESNESVSDTSGNLQTSAQTMSQQAQLFGSNINTVTAMNQPPVYATDAAATPANQAIEATKDVGSRDQTKLVNPNERDMGTLSAGSDQNVNARGDVNT